MMMIAGLYGMLVLAQAVLGKEMAQNMKKAAELYDTGIMMGKIMDRKMVC